MAAYALPQFDSSDPSQANFTSFDDIFNVDPPSFGNTQNGKLETSMPYPYESLSETTHSFLQRSASAGTPINLTSASENFVFQHPNMWQDLSSNHKSGLGGMDADFCTSAVTDSNVDYGFLAGESSGLLGVDPSVIQKQQQQQPPNSVINPFGTISPFQIGPTSGSVISQSQSQATTLSPASQNSSSIWNAPSHSQANSPYLSNPIPNYHTPSSHHGSRPPSIHSMGSRYSHGSPRYNSVEVDDDGRERTQCPYPECRKSFKDLKAHMLTHQNERPEKCPITSCEFHKRGFARKYDRNRHLVTTHYKATIVCGFCPGSGSSSEKSFNRTDVFKRHLVTVHGVEQNPSNSKKKTPRSSARQSPALPEDATGKCSTCGQIFATPQDLFEHFDDCVLRVVTQTDPAEEANEKNLRSVADDGDVKATLDRHSLPTDIASSPSSANGDANEDSDGVDDNNANSRTARSGKGTVGAPKSQATGSSLHTVTDGHVSKNSNWGKASGKGRAGVTYSKGGVSLSVGKGRKKKKYYPQSWGCPTDQMKLKKRVLCVFDGSRRLCKDDMMLGDDFEVRMKLPNAEDNSWVTDLDVETMKRAEGFHNATEEERGPWIPSNYSGDWTAQMFQDFHQQQQLPLVQQHHFKQ